MKTPHNRSSFGIISPHKLSPELIDKLRNTSGGLRLSDEFDPSPGKTTFTTLTPSKREFTAGRRIDFDFEMGEEKRLGLTFATEANSKENIPPAKRLKRESGAKAVTLDLPIVKSAIESGVITPDKFASKQRSRSQKQVMHITAADEVWGKLKEISPEQAKQLQAEVPNRDIHWCHILAFCLISGSWDPQIKDNLAAGPGLFNQNQRKYETSLKKILKEQAYKSMEITGNLESYQDTNIAKAITLDIKLTLKHSGNCIGFKIRFDANSTECESSEYTSLFRFVTNTIAERDAEKCKL